MFRIELIGLCGDMLNEEQRHLLRHCVAVAVSRRHQPLLDGIPIPHIAITPVTALLDGIAERLAIGPVAVLASGDPLCHGIGRRLIDRFGPERLRVHPALSALQLACARFCIPWDDMTLLSLHGREPGDIAARILSREKTFLFTDPENSPDQVARLVLATLQACDAEDRAASLHLRVAENLGLADERLTQGSIQEIAAGSFGPLNVMLVEQPPLAPGPVFGLREEEIAHSRGLITKNEVRAASLAALRLPATGVFWDVGGGSGSISLEAARIAPGLRIYTVEKEEEQLAHIRANIKTFGAWSIQPCAGMAPEVLRGLPAPDRVFVGGSGGRLSALLKAAAARLLPGGRILVNTVRPESEQEALDCLQSLGLTVQSATLAVTRRGHSPMADTAESRILNPITLITGEKTT